MLGGKARALAVIVELIIVHQYFERIHLPEQVTVVLKLKEGGLRWLSQM